jgi:hypothetical protein
MRKVVGLAVAVALGLALGACSSRGEDTPKVAAGDEHVACALAGKAQFAPDCAVERNREGDTLFLTVRHPDGGFRRFEVLKDGRGLAPADGMQPAEVKLLGNLLEVAVDGDRYRFPATAAKHDGKP